MIIYIYKHLSVGTEENHENINQDNRCVDRDLNPGPPEYAEEVLPP
jgi:hypothetical protein